MTVRHYDWLAHHARATPDKIAAVDLHAERRFTYAEFDARAERLAAHLQGALGTAPGDRVAVLMQNSTDFMEAQFACAKIGTVFVPLNWRLTVPELEFIVGDAAPQVLVHGKEFAQTAAALKERCALPHVLETDGDGGDTAYERALAAARPGAIDRAAPTHDDLQMIMYTSGTTGRPKGAIITYGMTFWNAVNLGIPCNITPDTVAVTVLPLFHTGGLNCYTNPVFHAGGTVLIMHSFDPGRTLELIDDPARSITHFFGVPSVYLFMSQHPDFAATDFSRLVRAGVGGAPTPQPLLEAYRDKGIALVQGFGMTETSPAVMFQTPELAVRKVGSAGRPVLHNEIRIVDEAGEDVPTDTVGELWVKGPNITPGYWNRPDATAEAITDGWLHTGDAARRDADGDVYIVDRWKDMYISGGENVYPAEVESVIAALPQVGEVAVLGLPDERWGEAGCAVIAVKEGESLATDDVIGHCRERLAAFKIPKSVVFVDALPRNATGKVLKRVLRDEVAEQVEAAE